MKKILFIASICLITFLIYLTTIDRKVYYLALGDLYAMGVNSYGIKDYGYKDSINDYLVSKNILEKSISFIDKDYRTTDLMRDIIDNKENDNIKLKQALIKADLVTISIGFNDLYGKVSKEYIDSSINDLKNLFIKIREYCKEDIIFIGYVIDDYLMPYIDDRYEQLCNKYNIKYISFYENIGLLDTKYPSKENYMDISKVIINEIESNLLK